MLDFILFDLDNTLYYRDCGLFDHIDNLINLYLENVVKIPAAEVDLKRRAYFKAYGTTLNGLMIHHQVDPYDYLKFVHNVPLGNFIKPEPELKSMLGALPQKKFIFSNASKEHCQNVLVQLDIKDCFTEIFDIGYFDFRPKPDISIYREILEDIGARPEAGMMIDDMPVNLKPAADLGMATVILNPAKNKSLTLPPGCKILTSLFDLPQLIDDSQ